ncbi:MAG: DUF4177 domain-containing protein [Candidatus Hydrogenedentes bacterium]|nr:DUF4177 domain-containing protein [Candidatus Hydrogenedentota bacterium]
MYTWEYTTLKLNTTGILGGKFDELDLNERLNALGIEGWELVTAFDTNQAYGQTRDVVLILKRRTS